MKAWIPFSLVLFAIPTYAAEPDPLFSNGHLHRIHLSLTAKDYKAMDPPPVNIFAPKPAIGRPAFGSPDAGAGNMNYEFEYVRADFEAEGKTLKDVGVRYKGSGTYLMSHRQAKRSLKIDFDRYDAKHAFHGATKLNLNSGVIDPSKSREALAYSVFRAAGVPAPRTSFADVTLSVPGQFHREVLGVFTVVEQVDKAFLKAHFENAKGLLLKPEGIRGLPHLGTEKLAFEASYNAKTAGDDAAWKRLIEFTRLVNKSDAAEFRAKIGDYLDLDAFARFLAANALLAHTDSFIGLGHNYYLYLSPKTNKFVFFPWDLDIAFGGFIMFGTQDQQADLSIEHPHVGENKLIDRVLAMPDVKEKYLGHVRRLHTELFASGKLAKEADGLAELLKESLAKEKKAAQGRKEDFANMNNPFSPPATPLRVFIEKRTEKVAAQLAGKSQGIIPGTNRGGPQPSGRPPKR